MNHTVSLQAYDGSTIIISFDNAIAIATLLQQYREQTGYGGCIELFDMEHPTERPLEHSMVVDSNKMFLVQKSEFEAIPDKDTLQQLVDRYCDDSFTDEEREHYGPIENWNIRLITNLSELFRDIPHFNQSLNNWDTSHVTNMNCMFSDAFAFNKPLDNWDVSNVSNMCSMFHDAKVFNQPLNNWDVSHATDMSFMFSGTHVFNKPLDNWDVSNVTNMDGMFYDALAFNQSLWDTSHETNRSSMLMFDGAIAFNRSLDDK